VSALETSPFSPFLDGADAPPKMARPLIRRTNLASALPGKWSEMARNGEKMVFAGVLTMGIRNAPMALGSTPASYTVAGSSPYFGHQNFDQI
jgi:hypothetical protein